MAASLSLECGEDAYSAFQFLELGRGVITTLYFETRGDISNLERSYPNLAEQLRHLRDMVDCNPNELEVSGEFSNITDYFRNASEEFEGPQEDSSIR